MILVLYIALLWIRCEAVGVPELECPAPEEKNAKFKLSVVSSKNKTGQWVAKVHFDHDAEETEAQPWHLDLDHSAFKCGHVETVAIDAVIVSPITVVKVAEGVKAVENETKEGTKPRREDYEFVEGTGYYKLHKEPKNWLEALNICAAEDAHLLILDSEEEVKAIKPILKKHPKPFQDWKDYVIYIGIHDYFSPGKYYTVFSEPVDKLYNKWSSEPSWPHELCGFVDREGLLGDAGCGESLVFICEQDL